ncbi:hypothetical protein B0T14DRAFT_523003 [Immersiella caudata]|uniref:Uncharacterized protein n=1 Tax=Immersiella caudata TaxID=314043 RepID=A0AA40BWR0_9PEZI|nr:hypothetical protein B0T14DRAFT_523003 [Immersiella caudata]
MATSTAQNPIRIGIASAVCLFIEKDSGGWVLAHGSVAFGGIMKKLETFRSSTIRRHGSEMGNGNVERLIGRRDLVSRGRLRLRVFRLTTAPAAQCSWKCGGGIAGHLRVVVLGTLRIESGLFFWPGFVRSQSRRELFRPPFSATRCMRPSILSVLTSRRTVRIVCDTDITDCKAWLLLLHDLKSRPWHRQLAFSGSHQSPSHRAQSRNVAPKIRPEPQQMG